MPPRRRGRLGVLLWKKSEAAASSMARKAKKKKRACSSQIHQEDDEGFQLPAQMLHGHTQAVSAIRYFPNYCHLLLSSSMDTTVKIWDVHGHGRRCMRTYGGHSVGVKDICFANDRSRFLSASFDRSMKLWDTETGDAISTFSTGKMIPYVAKLHPDDDKQHILLAGTSRGNKVVEWDTRTGKVTQSYEGHFGAVNTITFTDENRRFVISSDDLSLMVWEFGIPVVIKTHSGSPHAHDIVHSRASGEEMDGGESMDDQIVVYSTGGKVRQNGRDSPDILRVYHFDDTL